MDEPQIGQIHKLVQLNSNSYVFMTYTMNIVNVKQIQIKYILLLH